MCTLPHSARGGGGVSPLPNFQKRGPSQDFNFHWRLVGKRRVTVLKRGCSFYIKNRLKSETSKDKKVCKSYSHLTYMTIRRIFLRESDPKNLECKNPKWKIMLNLLNTIFRIIIIKRIKSNIFHVIIIAI